MLDTNQTARQQNLEEELMQQKPAATPQAGRVRGVSVDIYSAASITFELEASVGPGDSASASASARGAVTLTIDSTFPFYDPIDTRGSSSGDVRITIHTSPAIAQLEFEVALRIPSWVAKSSVDIGLNGNNSFVTGAPTGEYQSIRRMWTDGDVLQLDLPMALRATRYIGANQVNHTVRWAYEYGPTLLAARNTSAAGWDASMECIPIRGVDASDPGSWLVLAPGSDGAADGIFDGDGDIDGDRPTGGTASSMRFVPTKAAASNNVEFVPYFQIADEAMTVFPCYMP
jgi:hypothetical protein